MIEGVNLIPDEIRRRWRIERFRKSLVVAAVIYLAGLGLVFAQHKSDYIDKGAEEQRLERAKAAIMGKRAEYTAYLSIIERDKRKSAEAKARRSSLSGLIEKRTSWSTLLKILSHEAPSRLWVRGLTTSGPKGNKTIRFVGSALQSSKATEFAFTLQNLRYFKDVKLAYIQGRDVGDGQVFDFEISADLKAENFK